MSAAAGPATARRLGAACAVLLTILCGPDASAHARQPREASIRIDVRTGVADGVTLRYLTAGSGPTIVLLHGYAETSRMWRPLMPVLAPRYTVIAPDLPGIGGSDIPADGLDVTRAAVRIHALVKGLGIGKAVIVGHDIGLMVAYAYAAQFPSETRKLVLMDAFLPGVAGWEAIYNDPSIWHFRFHGATPEALVRGRERIYFEHFWNDFAADRTKSIPESDRRAYTAAYARPGRMRAAWAYFASFPQTAKDFSRLSRTRLTMPVPLDWRRGGERRRTRAADQVDRDGCDRRRAAAYGALVDGRRPAGDDGRIDRIPRPRTTRCAARRFCAIPMIAAVAARG